MHILQCRSDQAQSHFMTAWGALDEWLEQTTSVEIGQAIYVIIDDYRKGETSGPWTTWSRTLCSTYASQQKIGPRSFVEGFLSKQWEHAQFEHLLLTNNRRKSPSHWVKNLNYRIYKMTHKMWTLRCDFLHLTTTQNSLHHDTYHSALTHLLKEPPPLSMPAEDRRYFVPLTKALTYNIQRQKQLVNILRTFNDAHHQRTNSKSAQLLRNWLANNPG